jgi:hypothetical protein
VTDLILNAFLEQQFQEGLALAKTSDVLELSPLPLSGGPPTHYIARFSCTGVLRQKDGGIVPTRAQFHVGLTFPADYLRRIDPLRIATWLGPMNVVHPNIRPPFVCLGRVKPGTTLVDLLYQLYEIITYVNWASHDYLEGQAAVWARNHQHLFPLERRPLKRRALNVRVQKQSKKGPRA